jgi:hypothetical protein
VSFSHNGEWLLYADKFGVVYVVSTKSIEHNPPPEQSVQLLAHCCSIITSMVCMLRTLCLVLMLGLKIESCIAWLLFGGRSCRSVTRNCMPALVLDLLTTLLFDDQECSVDGRFVITGDRDFKIRVRFY